MDVVWGERGLYGEEHCAVLRDPAVQMARALDFNWIFALLREGAMNYASRGFFTWRDGVSESMLHHDLFVCNAIAVVVYTTRAESRFLSHDL